MLKSAFCLLLVWTTAIAQDKDSATRAGDDTAVRDPFVLKLLVDNEHYYEERFEGTPFVADGDVYLFSGEAFGIKVTSDKKRVLRVLYEHDSTKADVAFTFTQEKRQNGLMMLLVIRNRLKQVLVFDALMTIPGKKEIYRTSLLPVGPSLTNYESWPHPIVQLVLRNFRFSENGSKTSAVLPQNLAHP